MVRTRLELVNIILINEGGNFRNEVTVFFTTEYQFIKDKGIDDMVKRCNEIMRKEKKEKGAKQSDKII